MYPCVFSRQCTEGDKETYTERLDATKATNKTAIANLREENKEMEKRLRSLKNQPKVRFIGFCFCLIFMTNNCGSRRTCTVPSRCVAQAPGVPG